MLHRALLPLEKKGRKKEQQVKKKGGLGREQARAEQQEKVQGARAREEKEKEKRWRVTKGSLLNTLATSSRPCFAYRFLFVNSLSLSLTLLSPLPPKQRKEEEEKARKGGGEHFPSPATKKVAGGGRGKSLPARFSLSPVALSRRPGSPRVARWRPFRHQAAKEFDR